VLNNLKAVLVQGELPLEAADVVDWNLVRLELDVGGPRAGEALDVELTDEGFLILVNVQGLEEFQGCLDSRHSWGMQRMDPLEKGLKVVQRREKGPEEADEDRKHGEWFCWRQLGVSGD